MEGKKKKKLVQCRIWWTSVMHRHTVRWEQGGLMRRKTLTDTAAAIEANFGHFDF
jgi:hypothetical protein